MSMGWDPLAALHGLKRHSGLRSRLQCNGANIHCRQYILTSKGCRGVQRCGECSQSQPDSRDCCCHQKTRWGTRTVDHDAPRVVLVFIAMALGPESSHEVMRASANAYSVMPKPGGSGVPSPCTAAWVRASVRSRETMQWWWVSERLGARWPLACQCMHASSCKQ
jgi:hypothetical protein